MSTGASTLVVILCTGLAPSAVAGIEECVATAPPQPSDTGNWIAALRADPSGALETIGDACGNTDPGNQVPGWLGDYVVDTVADGPGSLLRCVNSLDETAMPATPPMNGNGATTFQFFQSPTTGHVYVSWNLVPNTLTNGADNWVFGLEISYLYNGGDEGSYIQSDYNVHNLAGDRCALVAPNVNLGGFGWYVDAGAGGWSGAASCTLEFHWELTVGVKVKPTGPEASAEVALGGSISCTAGIHWDSESLIRHSGSGSLICPECVDMIFPDTAIRRNGG